MGENIPEQILEVRDYKGEGYSPLVDFGEWRVAVLHYLDAIHPSRNDSMERHLSSDEVFVLVNGRGIILLGGNGSRIDGAVPQVMDHGVAYDIKAGAWHTILLSRDARVLIVENRDVSDKNSEFQPMPPELRQQIIALSNQENIA